MKDIIPAKKQSPILGLSGMGGGVGSNIVAGGAADSTYVDDVFSTYLWKGTGADQSFNNGIKLGNSNAGSGVGFDGTGDYLTLQSTSDVTFGTGDFTIEFWVKKLDSTQGGFFQISSTVGGFSSSGLGNTIAAAWNGSAWQMYGGGVDSTGTGSITANAWYHIAVVKSSNTLKMYVNGASVMSRSDTNNYSHTYLGINGYYSTTYTNKGILSNFRVVKGTAVYTGNFTPPTAELKSIANTKLLCCNTPVMTTATVTPGDITVYGDPHPSGGPFTAIDGEGGMVWMKARNAGGNFVLLDTERGIDKLMFTDGTWDENAAAANDKANTFRSFDNNGFTIGTTGYVNTSGEEYSSWTWRKQKGFFDIVTYTGTGSATTIPHNLGSVPGMIVIKRRSGPDGWRVYHRGASATPAATSLRFDTSDTLQSGGAYFNDTLPTSSVFSVGTHDTTNGNGMTYVAYLFAGGQSTAADARSVDFDGNDSLEISDSADFDLGNGNFTAEMWVKSNENPTSGNKALLGQWSSGNKSWAVSWSRANQSMDGWAFKYSPDGSNETGIFGARLDDNQWHHIAVVRDSTNIKLYTDGKLSATHAHSGATFYNSNQPCYIAREGYSNSEYTGRISNIRLVKGTAVYTSSFRPSYNPLANITNTVLLCCNNSSATGSTVTPGTITAGGDPTVNINSPFDDPNGFNFGEEGDQNIIKCGSYTGNGDTSNGTKVYLGFEPQWVMIKSTGFTEHWHCFDSMRGMTNKVNNGVRGIDARFETNQTNNTETTSVDFIDVNSDGFTAFYNANVNATNENFVYIAVRRPDGYVAKPTESGTDLFTQAYGLTSGDFRFTSGFPIDFAWAKLYDGGGSWWTSARLIQGGDLKTDSDDSENGASNKIFDNQFSWHASLSQGNAHISHMWKRGAGFDVVAYKGDGNAGNQITHNLAKTPEMMWVKRRNSGSTNWHVYHKDLNGGTNPATKFLNLNNSTAEQTSITIWNDTAPTSTHFTLGNNSDVNTPSGTYLAILFASVDGVSKLGTYTGSASDVTINLGFKPRFIIIKAYNSGSGSQRWTVLDSLRGMGAGSIDKRIYLDADNQQSQGDFITSISATGITMKTNYSYTNSNGYEYLYYAHA